MTARLLPPPNEPIGGSSLDLQAEPTLSCPTTPHDHPSALVESDHYLSTDLERLALDSEPRTEEPADSDGETCQSGTGNQEDKQINSEDERSDVEADNPSSEDENGEYLSSKAIPKS